MYKSLNERACGEGKLPESFQFSGVISVPFETFHFIHPTDIPNMKGDNDV